MIPKGDCGAPLLVRAIARVVLALYPGWFRREHAADYRDAVEHRWRIERARGRGAGWRTVRVLLLDALSAVPEGRRHRDAIDELEDGGGWRGMTDGLMQDARLAIRSLARRPGFTALVVLTLSAGIGAHAALFGALDRFLLRPLPFDGGERMGFVTLRSVETGFMGSPTQELLERWREGTTTLEGIEVFRRGTALRPAPDGTTERLSRMEVSGGLASFVGVSPVVGRALVPDDARAGATPAVMLGEAFWTREFGRDPTVPGRSIVMSDTTYTIVGVWPAAATLDVDGGADVWAVIPPDSEANPSRLTWMITRLEPGADPGRASEELAALMEGVEREGSTERVPHVALPVEFLAPAFVTGLRVGWIGVVLLLGVAVVNAAGLLLNRAVTRGEEIGVRLALGSSSGRLVRLFLVEGGILALAGALGGLALARWGGAALAQVAPERFPELTGAIWNGRVLIAGTAAAAVAGLVCGLVPAIHLRSPAVRRLLTGSAAAARRGRGIRLGSALVAAQVALALVLAVGAGLGVRSFRALQDVDPGFDLERLAVLAVSLPSARYPTADDRVAFWSRAMDGFRSIPGVEGVTTSGVPPFSFSISFGEPTLVGEDPPPPLAEYTSQGSAGPDFFEVMGIPVLEGRAEPDRPLAAGERVGEIVVNRAFAERRPGSVVGREMQFPEVEGSTPIVGVVENVRAHGLADGQVRAQYYWLEGAPTDSYERFIFRASGDPASVLAAARARVAEVDPLLSLAAATTGPEILRRQTADHRFLATVLGIFGAIALTVASLGVYGAVSLAVQSRMRETGVRVALGAGQRRIVGHVLAVGFRPVLAGLVLGGAVTFGLAPYLRVALYEIGPTEPASYALAVLTLVAAGLAACLIPARRALRVDPVRTLRSE